MREWQGRSVAVAVAAATETGPVVVVVVVVVVVAVVVAVVASCWLRERRRSDTNQQSVPAEIGTACAFLGALDSWTRTAP